MNGEQKYYPIYLNNKEADAFKEYLESHHIYYEEVRKIPDLNRFLCLMHIDEAENAAHWLEEFRGGRKK